MKTRPPDNLDLSGAKLIAFNTTTEQPRGWLSSSLGHITFNANDAQRVIDWLTEFVEWSKQRRTK